MMRTSVAALIVIVLGVSVPDAQDNQDPFDPAVAVPKAWAILTSAIEAGVLQDQHNVVSALAATGTPRALDLFERVAREGSPPVRRTALWFLPLENNSRYLPLVADALQDPDLEVRQRAILRLGWIRDPGTLPLLQNAIMAGDADMIGYAVGSARLLGPSALDVLLRCLEMGDERTRAQMVQTIYLIVATDTPRTSADRASTAAENLEALRRLRRESVLIKTLDDSDSAVRVFAALILARLGNAAGADELVRVSEAADPQFGTIASRHYAMAALYALGRAEYLPGLAKALEHPEQRVRLDAASAMQWFPHPSMYGIWEAIWRGTFPADVRYQAFQGMIALRRTDRGLLRAGLVDSDVGVKLAAAEALLALGNDSASVDVLERLAVEQPRIRGTALSLLSTKGDARRTAVVARSLLPRLNDLPRASREINLLATWLTIIHTLQVVRDRDAVPALAALLGPEQNLDRGVVRALVAIGDDTARRTLVRAMDSPDSAVRIHAAGGVISAYDR